MEIFMLILSIMAAVLASSFVSRFIPRISTPLVQIALGIVLALLPFFPPMRLDPELFMVLFIAPLLYYEAHTINKVELVKTLKLSLSLAIGLAAFTMLMVGVLLNAVWPMYPIAAALALGAALGPTDAVAVSSIGQEVDLSKRQRSVLSGESLFNDATGVIGFQFAILAAVTGKFSIVDAVSSFFISFIGGILFGILMGVVTNWVFDTARRLGWESMTTRILMELFLPFLIYLVADNWLDVSGILAVVATGLTVHFDHKSVGPNTSKTNIVSSSVWKVLSFCLNGAVFIILGMLLPEAIMTPWSDRKVGNLTLLATIALVSCTVIVVRFIWVTGVLYFAVNPTTGKRTPMDGRRLRSAGIMTFGGPKGTITLSLALTIPFTVSSGADFPMRNEIIFVAAGVIIVTLLLANFGLPLLAPAKNNQTKTSQIEKTIEVLRRTVEELSSRPANGKRLGLQHVLTLYNERITHLQSEIGEYNSTESQELHVQTLHWEQSFMEHKLEEIRHEEGNQPTTAPTEDTTDTTPSLASQEQAAEQMLEHITSSLAHIDDGRHIKWHLHKIWLRINGLVRHYIHKLSNTAMPISENEVFQAGKNIQAELSHYVVEQLYGELNKGKFNTEELLTAIGNHQLVKSAVEGSINISSGSGLREGMEEFMQEGYSIELSVIQDMVEAGEISRSLAHDLRRNVYFMQVDNDAIL